MKQLLALLFVTCFLASAQSREHAMGVLFDTPDGSPLLSGKSISFAVPYNCNAINSWDLIVDQGTAAVDVWKTAANQPPPTSSNSITGGSSPAVNSGRHAYSTNLAGWTRSVAAHDFFTFYLKYTTGGVTQASLVLGCQ